MTQLFRKCRWCGGAFVPPPGPGRPQEYCRRSHRQRAYEARKIAEAHSLGQDDVLLSRESFETLRDLLYRIEIAWQDAESDLAMAKNAKDVVEAVEGLGLVLGEVKGTRIEPKAIGSSD